MIVKSRLNSLSFYLFFCASRHVRNDWERLKGITGRALLLKIGRDGHYQSACAQVPPSERDGAPAEFLADSCNHPIFAKFIRSRIDTDTPLLADWLRVF